MSTKKTKDMKFWRWTYLKDMVVARSWHTEQIPKGIRATLTFLRKPNNGLRVGAEVYESGASTDKYFNVFNDGSLAMAWIEEVRAFIESKNSKA